MQKFAVFFACLAVGCSDTHATTSWRPRAAAIAGYAIAIDVTHEPIQPLGGQCPDCSGTGRLGDGVIVIECGRCDGTGKLDKSSVNVKKLAQQGGACPPGGT